MDYFRLYISSIDSCRGIWTGKVKMFEKWKQRREERLLKWYKREMEWLEEYEARNLYPRQGVELGQRVVDWRYSPRTDFSGCSDDRDSCRGTIESIIIEIREHPRLIFSDYYTYSVSTAEGHLLLDIDTRRGYHKDVKSGIVDLFKSVKEQGIIRNNILKEQNEEKKDQKRVQDVTYARSLLQYGKRDEEK